MQSVHESFFWPCTAACISLPCTPVLGKDMQSRMRMLSCLHILSRMRMHSCLHMFAIAMHCSTCLCHALQCISLPCTPVLVSSEQPCLVKAADTYVVWCKSACICGSRAVWIVGSFYQLEHPLFQRGGRLCRVTRHCVEGVKIEEKALREEALRSATGKVGGVRREQGTRAT